MVVIQCWIDRKRPKLLNIHDIPAHLAAIVIFLYLRLVVHILFLILILPPENASLKLASTEDGCQLQRNEKHIIRPKAYGSFRSNCLVRNLS